MEEVAIATAVVLLWGLFPTIIFLRASVARAVKNLDSWLGYTCAKCGYPLSGLASTRCPECGLRFVKHTLDDLPGKRHPLAHAYLVACLLPVIISPAVLAMAPILAIALPLFMSLHASSVEHLASWKHDPYPVKRATMPILTSLIVDSLIGVGSLAFWLSFAGAS